jgi:predicted nucleotidyltransferase
MNKPTNSIAQALREIAEKYEVQLVYAFGSRTLEIARHVRKGTPLRTDRQSDVDIGILCSKRRILTARERARMALELEDRFGVHRVDLVILNEADPFLALEVIRGEILYSKDPDEEAEYELYVMRRGGDLAPYERERRRLILSGF